MQDEQASETAQESEIAKVSQELGERKGDAEMMEYLVMRSGKQWRETMLKVRGIMEHC